MLLKDRPPPPPGWTKFPTFPENPKPGALLRPGSNFVCRTYRGGGAEERRGDRGRGATVDAREGAWGVRHHRRLGAQVRKYFLLRPLIKYLKNNWQRHNGPDHKITVHSSQDLNILQLQSLD